MIQMQADDDDKMESRVEGRKERKIILHFEERDVLDVFIERW